MTDGIPIKTSTRTIMYASHIDNFIYKHYAEKLNIQYNQWVEANQIDENVIAYRFKEGEKGKSNIDYAADVINAIRKFETCYIFIGDFKGYFDSLNHHKLKANLCEVLGVDRLSHDWFKVFQSVTKYSYYNKRVLNKFCGSYKKLRRLKQYTYFKNPKGFRKFKELYPVQTNNTEVGIPQGTAISALLSNAYAIHFDIGVKKLVNQYGGIYRRYSDDFIIVVPTRTLQHVYQFESLKKTIYLLKDKEALEIKEDKTGSYLYNHETITNLKEDKHDKIDYLGFVFDGINVKMKDKSPYKFYRNAYKLIRKTKKVKGRKGLKKIPYRKRLYRLYTNLDMHSGYYGNFITYAENAQTKFDRISPDTSNLMMDQIKNRKIHIERMLGYNINVKVLADISILVLILLQIK